MAPFACEGGGERSERGMRAVRRVVAVCQLQRVQYPAKTTGINCQWQSSAPVTGAIPSERVPGSRRS